MRKCICGCEEEIGTKCCDGKNVYKYYLIGFKYEDSRITEIDSSGFKNGEEVLLRRAEEIGERTFYSLKILAVDISLNTLYCKDVSLKQTVKATLC